MGIFMMRLLGFVAGMDGGGGGIDERIHRDCAVFERVLAGEEYPRVRDGALEMELAALAQGVAENGKMERWTYVSIGARVGQGAIAGRGKIVLEHKTADGVSLPAGAVPAGDQFVAGNVRMLDLGALKRRANAVVNGSLQVVRRRQIDVISREGGPRMKMGGVHRWPVLHVAKAPAHDAVAYGVKGVVIGRSGDSRRDTDGHDAHGGEATHERAEVVGHGGGRAVGELDAFQAVVGEPTPADEAVDCRLPPEYAVAGIEVRVVRAEVREGGVAVERAVQHQHVLGKKFAHAHKKTDAANPRWVCNSGRDVGVRDGAREREGAIGAVAEHEFAV